MAIADFLQTIGRGVETGLENAGKGAATAGRVAGTIAPTLGKSVAETLSGEAPQIHEEERQQQQKLEDAALNAKASELESQLEMGRKYGTLTPQQQQQYVDSITQLYSHPRHMGTLMQKLQKAVHPNGATYQAPSSLPEATPQGGTAAADEAARMKAFEDEQRLRAQYQKANYKAYKLPDGSVVNVDTTRESPPDGAVPVSTESLTQHRQSKPVSSPSHGGTILASFDPQTGKYFDQSGQEITDAKPAASGAVSTQYANLYGKALLAKEGKGPQLTPEEQAQLEGLKSAMTIGPLTRAEGMAKYGAIYNLTQVQDPATGADVWVPRMDVISAARSGNNALASRNSQRAMLAASALQQIYTMKDVIEHHPALFGPVSGRISELQQYGGLQSPEFAKFAAAALYLAEHGSGVFGSRSIHTVQDLENTITDPAFNPKALMAALDQSEKTNQMFLNPTGAQLPSSTGAAPVKPGSILPKTGAQSLQKLNDALQNALNP